MNSPDLIEVEMAVQRAAAYTSPKSLKVDARTGHVKVEIRGVFTASQLRIKADELDRINNELSSLTR